MYQDLQQFKVPQGFRGRSGMVVQLWWLVQATLFRWSPQVCYGWRRYLLRCFGAKVGTSVVIRPTVTVTYPWKVSIGDYSMIGDDAVLYSLGDIQIGNHAVVSQKCYLCTGSHDYQSESFDIYAKPIVIGDEAWLAMDVFVAPGVSVGKGTLVGSRSSIYQDLPPGMVCMGGPAKVVKAREMK